jgi:Protein of unknown function (DUF3570)
VQLTCRHSNGRVCQTLATLSLGLLSATLGDHAYGQSSLPQPSSSDSRNQIPTSKEIDTAILFYQEANGRVRAIEPEAQYTARGPSGQILNLGFVVDSVTGATPNGAVPSDQTQTFVTPLKATGSTATVTSASGGSTIIQLPPTSGQIATAARQYTTPPGQLPVDRGFRDQRYAGSIGYSQPLGEISLVGLGAAYSVERDYRSISLNTNIAQNFNLNNTPTSLSINYENDSSFPYGGVPTPLTVMAPQWKSVSARGKSQVDVVLGLTEVMTRNWLLQVNYSYNLSNGYQNDPYRIISVVDPNTGEPNSYLYENRPSMRQSQSLYFNNKLDFGPSVTNLSARYFVDSWGVKATTIELSDRVRLAGSLYIEPDVRWTEQSAAKFFRNYLVNGEAPPPYASSDARLGQFVGLTYGLKVGFDLTRSTEIYVRGAYYQQTGNGHPSDAIGQLKQQNLFTGVNAAYVMMGYSWNFD